MTSALQIWAVELTAWRCWWLSPGTFLLARMLYISKGVWVIADSERAVRRICPPPSPKEPSIFIISPCIFILHTQKKRVEYFDIRPVETLIVLVKTYG